MFFILISSKLFNCSMIQQITDSNTETQWDSMKVKRLDRERDIIYVEINKCIKEKDFKRDNLIMNRIYTTSFLFYTSEGLAALSYLSGLGGAPLGPELVKVLVSQAFLGDLLGDLLDDLLGDLELITLVSWWWLKVSRWRRGCENH